MLTSDKHTVTVLREDHFIERITRDRTVKATKSSDEDTPLSSEHSETENNDICTSKRNFEDRTVVTAVRTPHSVDKDAEWHVIDKVVKYLPDTYLVKIRWFGYQPEDDTLELPEHLRWNNFAAYFKATKEPVPRHLMKYRPSKKRGKHIDTRLDFK